MHAGVEEQQPAGEPPAQGAAADDRVHPDGAVGQEPDVLEAAERRDVLVLLADRLAQDLDFDFAGLARELGRRPPLGLHGVERVQDADGQRRTRAQPDPCGQVGDRRDFDPFRQPRHLHRLADQVVLEVVDVIHDFRSRVRHANAVVEPGIDSHVHVAVDGRRHDVAGPLPVVVLEVRTAPGQAHAKRRPRNDHAFAPGTRFAHAADARASAAGVPMSAK